MRQAAATRADGRGRALALIALGLVAADAVVASTGLGGASADRLFDEWVFNAAFAAAAASCLWRAVRYTDARAMWLALGGGLALWAAGEIYWTVALASSADIPFPSASDWLMLGFYPCAYAAVVLHVRERLRGVPRSVWLDGLVGALATAAVGTAVVFEPVLHASGGDELVIAVNLAYPLGDLLLLGLAAASLGLTAWRPDRTRVVLSAGLAAAALADGVFLYRGAASEFVESSAFDSLWTAAALLLAFAPWQRSRRLRPDGLSGRKLLVLPSAFALMAIGVLVAGQLTAVHPAAVVLAVATLIAVTTRLVLTLEENIRLLEQASHAASTDALTGLGNRRKLMDDLERTVALAADGDAHAAIVFDLDGFKLYNDAFGHPEGDLLLARLARKLRTAVAPWGTAYRVGGDEFCAVIRVDEETIDTVAAVAAAALHERGEGFFVTCSFGVVLLPDESSSAAHALKLADQRLYGKKEERPSAPALQTRDVLLRALEEREPRLRTHLQHVSELAAAVGRRLGLPAQELTTIARAAELHDVGKVAVPDAILLKPGPLSEEERDFMRRHTVVGEQILAAAPAMANVARLVRSSHERMDGGGYPDGLVGEEIPLGARIVAVCDAFDAMTSDRPYRRGVAPAAALAELTRCAPDQFDPAVVAAFCAVLAERGDGDVGAEVILMSAPAGRDQRPASPAGVGR